MTDGNMSAPIPHDPRLRVLDLRTPWFWVVVFHRRSYGKPRLEVSVYDERAATSRWWLNVWQREPGNAGRESE